MDFGPKSYKENQQSSTISSQRPSRAHNHEPNDK